MLNSHLYVIECVKIESIPEGIIQPVKNIKNTLEGMLFELNHVRVNPKLNNNYVIEKLTIALNQIGVNVADRPKSTSMAVCFKPLGEISDNVRFYLNKEGKLVFLSPAMRPRLVYSRP